MNTVILATFLLAVVANVAIWALLLRDWARDRRHRNGHADAPGRPPRRDRGRR